MNLSGIFSHVVHKRLVKGELPHGGSNQHELNGVATLKRFFNDRANDGVLAWHYFADDAEPSREDGTFTFYDARARSAHRTGRSEWRFYYYGEFLSRADVGDWVFLARGHDGRIFALVFQDNSAWLRAAQVLFGVEKSGASFDEIDETQLDRQRLELMRRQIVDELGLDIVVPANHSDEEIMMRAFGGVFPTTVKMSEFARRNVEADVANADAALLRWLDREEQLFRAMESVIIRKRIDEGFATVDEFISYSLSVQNRRKSRMGYALQNHLTEIFDQHNVRYTAQCRTEGKSRPDFIFPGYAEYHNLQFKQSLLVMLGVKSRNRERWRQVLDEADRIPRKHLCTLDQGISTSQTDAMHRRKITLVVPDGLHATYTAGQLSQILTLTEFIEMIRRNQAQAQAWLGQPRK